MLNNFKNFKDLISILCFLSTLSLNIKKRKRIRLGVDETKDVHPSDIDYERAVESWTYFKCIRNKRVWRHCKMWRTRSRSRHRQRTQVVQMVLLETLKPSRQQTQVCLFKNPDLKIKFKSRKLCYLIDLQTLR